MSEAALDAHAALAAVEQVAKEQEFFLVDAVWEILVAAGHERPKESRPMGAVLRRAAAAGWIASTGRFAPSSQPSCNRNPRQVWQSLLVQRKEPMVFAGAHSVRPGLPVHYETDRRGGLTYFAPAFIVVTEENYDPSSTGLDAPEGTTVHLVVLSPGQGTYVELSVPYEPEPGPDGLYPPRSWRWPS